MRVILEHELPESLFAGGVACPDSSGRPSGEFLQSVNVSTMDGLCAVALDEALVLLDGVSPTSEMADATVDYVLPLLTFLREELGSAGLIRPVLQVARTPADEAIVPHGAYSPAEPEQVGATSRGGKPMSVLRLLSFAWFDGGIRIYGPIAIVLVLVFVL